MPKTFNELCDEAKQNIQECTIEDVKDWMQEGRDFVLVDTREDNEWEAGHIKGAVHIGKGVIERDIEKKIPERDKEIILYCGGGFRSALAAESLQKMGYSNVKSMDGGWRGWTQSGGETE